MSESQTRRISRTALLAAAALCAMHTGAVASIISGTIVDRVGVFPFDASGMGNPVIRAYEVGDGVNHVTINPHFGAWWPWGASLYFTGSDLDGNAFGWHDTEVARVYGITDVSQITDASAYTFTNGYPDGPNGYPDPVPATHFVPTSAPPPDWVSAPTGLMLLRNIHTGHYGAVIFRNSWGFVEDFSMEYGPFSAMVELEWYFQTDGSGDFSSVPTPPTVALLAAGACLGRRRRR